MKVINFILILTAIFFIVSCKKKTQSVDFHENYFPLQKGKFVEYNVVSIHHDHASGVHDTDYYSLKTLVGDTVIDNSGRIARKFYRYIFDDIFQVYKINDLWTAIIDQERAELVEENQRIIKMIFVPTLSKEWDINAFNIDNPLYAYYENIHKSFSVNGFNFDSTITVIQEKMEPTLIDYRRKTEIYAKNIGLVHKYYKNIEIIGFDTLHPKNGDELYYTVKNFGVQ